MSLAMTTCLISLGGNIGDVPQRFDQALRRLHEPLEVVVTGCSSLFRTSAVGVDAGTEFFNAAAVLETTRTPLELLDRLLAIETELGRVRTLRWEPRTLDLDLLFYGAEVIDDPPRLKVPHVACWYRKFALDPLVQIAPHFVHPVKRLPLFELHRRLLVRPFQVCVLGQARNDDPAIRALQDTIPDLVLKVCRQPEDMPEADEGLVVRLDSGPLPLWATPLKQRVGWLDAGDMPGDRRQRLIDILRSAGL
jgi:2-amino-4-hydroxy-6-hydroxymethyldihydropteridine diphosphokinase